MDFRRLLEHLPERLKSLIPEYWTTRPEVQYTCDELFDTQRREQLFARLREAGVHFRFDAAAEDADPSIAFLEPDWHKVEQVLAAIRGWHGR